MAHFDGMDLFTAVGQGAAGGLFQLTAPSAKDATQEDGLGWVIETRQGSSYVLARGPVTLSYPLALRESLKAVQRGLDIFCIKGIQDAAVRNVESEHLCWWMEAQGVVLRVYFVSTLSIAFSAQATVTDQYGNLVSPPPLPPHIWHDSFRYFRLAQVTEDLFDAYRNTFLALESILSTLVPIHPREGEGNWFRRALIEVSNQYTLDLTRYAPSSGINLIDAIFTDFYTDKRNAIFHAKVHRTHFLPRNPNEHAIISSSLDRLVRLYLDLVEKGLGVRRLAGLMTVEGFNQLIAPQMQSLEIRASDDTAEANVNQIEVNPNGGTVISLQTRDAPELDLPMTKFLFGTIPAHELQDLQRLKKVSLNQNEILLSVGAIGGELTLDGIAELQVQMGVRVENKQMPKSIYVS